MDPSFYRKEAEEMRNTEINNLLRKAKEQRHQAAELEINGDPDAAEELRAAASKTQHQAEELRRKLYGKE